MGTGEFNAGGNPAKDKHLIQGGVEILLVASCYRNRDKLPPDWPHWPVCRLYHNHLVTSLRSGEAKLNFCKQFFLT